MKNVLHRHQISFKNAWAGVVWAFSTQPNFRIHGLLSALAVFCGWFFQISRTEWIIIVFTILLGFTGEMLNTTVESITDLVTTEWREEAKIAKDVAAGMMLVIAIGASCVGIIIFLPYLKGL